MLGVFRKYKLLGMFVVYLIKIYSSLVVTLDAPKLNHSCCAAGSQGTVGAWTVLHSNVNRIACCVKGASESEVL